MPSEVVSFFFAELGTRAGVHSQTLISTGLADLDRILGGGLPLGAILLVLEDAYSPHGSTLLRYFTAEGIACGHNVHWAAAFTPDAKSLPSLAKSQTASQVIQSPSNLIVIRIIIGAHLVFADSGCTMGACLGPTTSHAGRRQGSRKAGGPKAAHRLAVSPLHSETAAGQRKSAQPYDSTYL